MRADSLADLVNEFSDDEETNGMFEEFGQEKKKKDTEDNAKNDDMLLGGLLKRPNYAEMYQNQPQPGQQPAQHGQAKEVIVEEEDFSDAQEEMSDSDLDL